jgi:hypothetical protein
LNVLDVANRVKRTFGDDAGVQVTDDDIFRWINDAQLKISVDNEDLLETVGTANIVQGQADYSVPSNMNTLRSLMYNNFRIKGLSFGDFNEYLDGFKVPASESVFGLGRPEVFMVYGATMTLFPTPNQSITDGLRIYYSRHPASVGNLADALTVPDRYHPSVVDYCLQQAYEMDENAEMIGFKKSQFDESVQKLKEQEKWTNREFYPTITTLHEDSEYTEGIF